MNDLITRQAALDALEWKWAGKAAIDAIKNLPPVLTIDPVKHGKWIEKMRPIRSKWASMCECSICGDTVWVYDGYRSWNYCPNCGAKMDGGEDETDRGRKGNLQEIQ